MEKKDEIDLSYAVYSTILYVKDRLEIQGVCGSFVEVFHATNFTSILNRFVVKR